MSENEPPAEVFVPQAPGIKKSAYAKSVDQTYNAMMDQSVGRAEEAGDMLDAQLRASGVDDGTRREQVNQLKSDLKITNLKDPSEMREGDTAYVGPSADAAAQRLSIGASRPGFQNLAGGVPNAAPGIGPARSGAAAHSAINGHQGWVDGTPASPNPMHTARASAMVRAGQIGAYKE